MKKFLIIAAIVIGVVGIGFYFAQNDSKPFKTTDFASKPNDNQLLVNMAKAGLDVLSSEGTVMHIHQHFDIIINGQGESIPAQLGIATSFISPLHVHDSSNILHVESPVQKDFKLGQFFDEWGIDFNDNCVANNCANGTNKLIVAVNGKPISNVRDHVLGSHEEIEIWYGAKTQNPNLISAYSFPAGY